MYLRITHARVDPARSEEATSFVEDTIAAMQRQPGFQGFYQGADRSSGATVIVTLWDTEEHARVDRAAFGDVITRLQAIGVQMEPPAVYEVIGQA